MLSVTHSTHSLQLTFHTILLPSFFLEIFGESRDILVHMSAPDKKSNPLVPIVLVGLTLISLGLHLWRIGIPDEPVFDEAHFATYALDFATGKSYVDIHPPLGKLLYAGTIVLLDQSLSAQPPFLSIGKDAAQELKYSVTGVHFHPDFPYQALRLLAGLFGMALPLVLFWFLKNIGVTDLGALTATALVVLDNALLLDSRLILLNGMYLTLGFAALAYYFSPRARTLRAGILWGLSLAIKGIGILLLAPILIEQLFNPARNSRRLRIFILTGLGIFFASYVLNWTSFTPAAQIHTWQKLGFIKKVPALATHTDNFFGFLVSALYAWILSILFTVGGYTIGSPLSNPHPAASFWYQWPVMYRAMPLYLGEPGSNIGSITLAGNPVVWFAVLLTVLGFLIYLFSRFLHPKNLVTHLSRLRTPLILLGGYLGSLLPFILIDRNTFIYHYFPALCFGIGLVGWTIGTMYQNSRLPLWLRRSIVIALPLAALVGFIWTAPLTYGL